MLIDKIKVVLCLFLCYFLLKNEIILKCIKYISEIELYYHIEGYTHFPILANDIDNVNSLYKKCHKQVHTTKGCRYVDYKC